MSSQSLGLGWNISPQGFSLISENSAISDKNSLLRNALNSDLKEIGQPVLAKELNKSQITQLVLQIQKIRNVSAPKANEDSQAAPRMLKLTLTDGESYVQAIECSTIPTISREKTAPGSKLLLNNVRILNGFLILNKNNTKLLGGQVQHLFEKWELAKSVQHCSRHTVASDGPTAWVNFGSKILNSEAEFKLSDNQSKDQAKENTEFEALRQDAIANASTGAVKKVFGGGIKQPIQNNSRNDNRGKFDGNRGNKNNKKEVRNGRDKEIEDRPQKPSDKVSLFDFLEDKLNITETATSAKSNKDEIHVFQKPAFNDKKNYYNDKNYTNQRNNYNEKKEFNNYDRKYNHKEVTKKEPNRYHEPYNKYETTHNNSIMHKNEPYKTQEQYNTNKFHAKFSHFGRDDYKDTNKNPDHSTYNKRYGKYEHNDSYFHTNKDTNKSIRNEKERMKDSWHYRAPDTTNTNVENLSETVSKMSMNSEFASRSLRQHLNLEVKKPPPNNTYNEQNVKKFNVGDMCLVKYWEDEKFYPAKITASTDATYVVQFKGYGNIEEVLKTDCAPFRSQDRMEDKRQYKGSLEFRRNSRKFPSS